MAQQRGMKRAAKVLKRAQKKTKLHHENAVRLAHDAHEHAHHHHDHDHAHEHEHKEEKPKAKKATKKKEEA